MGNTLKKGMDAAYQLFNRRPALFGLAVAVALLLLPVAVWLDLRHISDVALERQAETLNEMITDIRAYYANNVVSRVQAHAGDSVAAADYAIVPGAIPIPATLSLELGEVVGEHGRNVRYRFVSDYPFEGREPHKLDDFERYALATFRSEKTASQQGHEIVTRIDGSLFDRRIRLAGPVVMGAACVECHNSSPLSPKQDWKVGDVRGIQAIEIEQAIVTNLASFKYLLAYFVGAGIFGVSFAVMQTYQAASYSRLNRELEETNSFLATVSLKISKYLSPQVYKSIFSGERDTTLTTERKKLTIFFSDIKDFTITSERLQPEELTELLNDYFTEMSAIAGKHGATLDKFIGDAILAFFGDPETRGPKEDARACVQMAIEMQKRLAELYVIWRAKGIEEPFKARIGINTGYCNVGNFGSNERMDYTIIGAEANLAARLESIAESGGIVMSYETYVHVADLVKAEPLEPIRLKGIGRDVIPYRVTDLEITQSGLEKIDERVDGARIYIDPHAITDENREQLLKALDRAKARLLKL